MWAGQTWRKRLVASRPFPPLSLPVNPSLYIRAPVANMAPDAKTRRPFAEVAPSVDRCNRHVQVLRQLQGCHQVVHALLSH